VCDDLQREDREVGLKSKRRRTAARRRKMRRNGSQMFAQEADTA